MIKKRDHEFERDWVLGKIWSEEVKGEMMQLYYYCKYIYYLLYY